MTECDICKYITTKIVSVVLAFIGGKERRLIVCENCANSIEIYIDQRRESYVTTDAARNG